MQTLRKFLKFIVILIIALWVLFFGIIIYAIISDYKPDEKTVIAENASPTLISDTAIVSLMTWNIGYCGLDREMDFFYDGGTKVRTPEPAFRQNFAAVSDFIKSNDSLDFILLQEVDRKSKRSYRMDEHAAIQEKLSKSSVQFATNYDVFFVPVPPSDPMGQVYSGISLFSNYDPSSSIRYSFPGNYGFPKQLFMLDRCFMVNRYPLQNGKQLVLINTHNEAFDPGEIRQAQMEYLKKFITGEYASGNYIIAGGDWNQTPPGFRPEFVSNKVNSAQMGINSNYLPVDWTWAFDSTTPSNRTVTGAYNPEVTTTTVIDFFLLSPNVSGLSVKCIDLGFANSDHNPVIIKAKLK